MGCLTEHHRWVSPSSRKSLNWSVPDQSEPRGSPMDNKRETLKFLWDERDLTLQLALRIFACASATVLTVFTLYWLIVGHSPPPSKCFAGVSVVTHQAVYTDCPTPPPTPPPDLR